MTADRPTAHTFPCPRCGGPTRLAGGWNDSDGYGRAFGRERAYRCLQCPEWFGTMETVLIPHMGKIGDTKHFSERGE